MSDTAYTSNEIMVVTACRFLKNGSIVFIGIGLPSLAANLARSLHAPDISMIYESGTLDTKPDRPPLSIGDDELSRKALSVVSVPEMFRYWLQGGVIETGFLGAAQIDRFGNLNTTVIGDYHNPKVRLPGAGGERRERRGGARSTAPRSQRRKWSPNQAWPCPLAESLPARGTTAQP